MQNTIQLQALSKLTPVQEYATEIITFLSVDDDCESVLETLRAAGYAQ